ncbi:MAG: V-type ATP synthase subunit A [Chloroflexi bacterium]|nr:V-type ATP synthase subunit A [Chloroflexota bacterium]
MSSRAGSIEAVDGPVVTVADAQGISIAELVLVGDDHLLGEVIRLEGNTATVQVYENTGGLEPGEPVYGTGGPLSVELGPGIIGNIFDGLQRPLEVIETRTGAFVHRGVSIPPLDRQRQWLFHPSVRPGEEIHRGSVLGSVFESDLIEHRLLVPVRLHMGGVSRTMLAERVAAVTPGEHTVGDYVASVDVDHRETRLQMMQRWPVRHARPYRQRLLPDVPLITGQRVIDTFFPIAKGGTAAIPGGFGTGKTVTQHQLAKWSDADIVVYIGCGERGNEMTEVLIDFPMLVDPRSGKPLMQRTVLIANTSNMPVAAREASMYTGVTLAEYYRDMGYDVAVMADSTSRWAEALREIAGRLEELPAEEGFPAYLPSRLAEFYERAGRVVTLGGMNGSVTIVGAVSPPGGNFSEPVTQNTLRFVRCFWALDKSLAAARHFPAINWIESYSEYLDSVEGWWSKNVFNDWRGLRNRAMGVLQEENHLQQIVKLVGADALPDEQRLVLETARMLREGFLQQNAMDPIDTYTTPQKQVAMLRSMMRFYERGREIVARGAPVIRLRELSIVAHLIRMKNEVPNDRLTEIDDIGLALDRQLNELESEYL